MEFTRSRKIVSKLNTLMDSFESIGEELSEIEVSLLSKYTEDLKQSFVDMCQMSKPSAEILLEESISQVTEDEESQITPTVEHKALNDINKPVKIIEPIKELNADVIDVDGDEKSTPQTIDSQVATSTSTSTESEDQRYSWKQDKSTTSQDIFEPNISDALNSDDDMDFGELFNTIEVKELSDRLKNSSIKDLNKSISINERILLKNELFNGDQSIMNETISHLNDLENFDQAADYLKKGIAREYNWADTAKMKKAIVFLQTVQRLYK